MRLCGMIVTGASPVSGKGFLVQCVLPHAHTGEHRDAIGNEFVYVPTIPSVA